MTLDSAVATTPTARGVTRQEVIKRFLRNTGFGEVGTVTTGASTTAWTILANIGRGANSKTWVGGFARAVQADAATPEGEVRPITAYNETTGAFTSTAFSANVEAGDEMELWRLHYPTTILDTLDEVLKETIWFPCWTILTDVPDGDMEQSHITDWTASNSTVTKQTSGSSHYGRRYLRTVTTSANGYAKSKDMLVEPNKQYHLSSLARVGAADTTAKLIAYDETNGAEIKSVSYVGQYWARPHMEFTTPATCYKVTVRLSVVENLSTAEWDEVCMYPINASEIRLPWWVKTKDALLRTFRMNPTDIITDVWEGILRGRHEPKWIVQDRFGGDNQLRLVSNGTSGISTPLYIIGLRNETAFVDDYTTPKYVNPDMLVTALMWKAYEQLAGHYMAGQADTTNFRAQAVYYEFKFKRLALQEMQRIQQIITDPKPNEYHLDGRFQMGQV